MSNTASLVLDRIFVKDYEGAFRKVRIFVVLHPLPNFVIRLADKGRVEVWHRLSRAMGDGGKIYGVKDTWRCTNFTVIDHSIATFVCLLDKLVE
jgi:hypothetical protein